MGMGGAEEGTEGALGARASDVGGFARGTDVAARYARCLHTWRWLTCFFSLALVGVGAVFGPPLLRNTSQELQPPPGSLSAKAGDAFQAAFPGQAAAAAVIVMLELDADAPTNSSAGGPAGLLSAAVRDFSLQLNASVFAYKPAGFATGFEGWWIAQELGLPAPARDGFLHSRYADPERVGRSAGDATYLVATGNAQTASRAAITFASYVRSEVARLWPPRGAPDGVGAPVTTSIVGLPAIVDALAASAERDLGLVDGIALPLSAAVLGYILRGVRLLLWPAVCIAVSALTAFAVMNAVALQTPLISFAPSLMSSVLVALSIDYALFLCSRFRTELRRGLEARDALVVSLRTAGHTVLLSGSTLVLCFFGLLALPVRVVQMPGVACGVAVSCTVAANLTVGPTLVLAFPAFFARCLQPWSAALPCLGRGTAGSHAGQRSGDGSAGKAERDGLLGTTAATTGKAANGSLPVASDKVGGGTSASAGGTFEATSRTSRADDSWREQHRGTCWYRLGQLTLHPVAGTALVAAVVGAALPFALQAAKTVTSDSFALDLPRGSDIESAYSAFAGAFGLGMLYPYRILVTPPSTMPPLSQGYFDASQEVVARMVAEVPGLAATDVQGLTMAYGINASWPLTAACLGMPPAPGDNRGAAPSMDVCALIRASVRRFVSDDGAGGATFMYAIPRIDPVGLSGAPFLDTMRALLERESAARGWSMQLQGIAAVSWDAIRAVYDNFAIMACITIGIVVAFVGVAFRSAVVPLRCVASIALSLAWVYGFAQLTYVDGALGWSQVPGLQSAGALMWIAPAMSLVICAGVCLDYDIMIGLRVLELRRAGHTTADAVHRGLCDTGRVVTAAGVVMGISFSGLIASNMMVVNQLGFYLVTAVLFDTFVVRSVLVPALMARLGEANWWPASLAGGRADAGPRKADADSAAAAL